MLKVISTNVVPALDAEADRLIDSGTPLGKVANAIHEKAVELLNRSLSDRDRMAIEDAGPKAASWAAGQVLSEGFDDNQYLRAIEELDQQSWIAMAREAQKLVDDNGKSMATAVYLVARKLFPKLYRNGFSAGILFWLTKNQFLTADCKFEAVDCNGLLPVHRVVAFLCSYYNPQEPNPTLNYAARVIHGDDRRAQRRQDAGANRDMPSANFAEPTERDGAPNHGEQAASDLIASTTEKYAEYCKKYKTAKTIGKHSNKAYVALRKALEKLGDDEVIDQDMVDIVLGEAQRDYDMVMAYIGKLV